MSLRRWSSCLLVALAAGVALPPGAHAATIPVTTTADGTGADGTCTLREALQAAGSDAAVDTCPAGQGHDDVVVPAGTIKLTAALEPPADVTIRGAGVAGTVLDGQDQSRVLRVAAPGVRVEALSLVRGHAPEGDLQDVGSGGKGGNGGAILVFSTHGAGGTPAGGLALYEVQIRDSRAGDGAPATGTGATGSAGGDGGAIALQDGTLDVQRSTLQGNRAGRGGRGVQGSGDGPGATGGPGGVGGAVVDFRGSSARVDRSTLTANAAGDGGAGADARPSTRACSPSAQDPAGGWGGAAGSGGAVASSTPILLTNDTIVANRTGTGGAGGAKGTTSPTCNGVDLAGRAGPPGLGGAVLQGGSGLVTIVSTTLTDNVASRGSVLALAEHGVADVHASILSGAGPACVGSIPSPPDGYDLSSDASCPGKVATVALDALGDNGGPTLTRLPTGPANPAVDTVPAGDRGCGYDQREVRRPQGQGCDVGAVEVTGGGVAPDTLITDGPSGDANGPDATLTFQATDQALDFACSLDGADFTSCASPASYVGLAAGPHAFRVRATDATGHTDATPAERDWTVSPALVALRLPTVTDKLLDNRRRVDVGAVDRTDRLKTVKAKLADTVKVACGAEALDETPEPCRGTLVLASLVRPAKPIPSTARLAVRGLPASVLEAVNPTPAAIKPGAAVVLNPVAFPKRDFAALNPQPFPPRGEDVALNPQPFPPKEGQDVSLNPQPFPPKDGRPTLSLVYLGSAPYSVGVGSVQAVTLAAAKAQLKALLAKTPEGFTAVLLNVTDVPDAQAAAPTRTADVVAKTAVKVPAPRRGAVSRR